MTASKGPGQAVVLAASQLPEAWVGDELLDLYEPGARCAARMTMGTDSPPERGSMVPPGYAQRHSI